MKALTLILFVLVAGFSYAQEEAVLDGVHETLEDFERALSSFEKGDAINGKQYFTGCLASLILVESDLLLFQDLDEMDAPLADFTATSDRCLSRIERTENALKLYEPQSWPLLPRMEVKTLNWLSMVKKLVTDYLLELSEPLSRADETWSEANHKLYEQYLVEYDRYLVVDEIWVEFQYEFAEANDFEIGGLVQLNVREEEEQDLEDYKNNARLLSDGEMETALSYFEGVLAYVLQIDAYFLKFAALDEEDAPLASFNANTNTCRSLIFDLRKAMVLYENRDWKKKKEFNAITEKWISTIEELLDHYIVPLSEPMSRPDDTWTTKELKFFDQKYLSAYDRYLKIDVEWVDFQTVFAEANNFTLGPGIDSERILD